MPLRGVVLIKSSGVCPTKASKNLKFLRITLEFLRIKLEFLKRHPLTPRKSRIPYRDPLVKLGDDSREF